MSCLKGDELKKLTTEEIYNILIQGVEVILNHKTDLKNQLEQKGQDNLVYYAAIVNEINALKKAQNSFLLFSQK